MIKFEQWVIMSKDRKVIATGVPRNRKLTSVDKLNNQRILTYKSKGMAESGFKNNWFYQGSLNYTRENLEAVKMEVTYKEELND